MKKICITFIVLFIIILTAITGGKNSDGADAYLRMHIRANSNAQIDQSVKYRVRDAVVEYLTPRVAECETKEQAMRMLRDNLSGIGEQATAALAAAGYGYAARASLKREEFPTRVYDGYTLEEGVYDALVVELGSGEGDNWWCVVYPPLCFTGEDDGSGQIRYRSKIIDIINRFKAK